MAKMKSGAVSVVLGLSAFMASSMEYHVSKEGQDTNSGSAAEPLLTISAAAQVAMPGDVITVHEGTYRERVNPPRGGKSDDARIVYRAANGENVVLKGSEPIDGWRSVQGDTWKARVPNTLFGDFNPYSDLINGDWFFDKERQHHTGAVYLNGHWLTEAPSLDDVMRPVGKTPLWFARVDDADTTVWAQFKGINPNEADIEINVRQSVFYPETAGMDYITVQGFTMMHAATPWAPPTAEQIGLVGTHWSKGWIIEDCDIRYSTCVGITLGKYGDQWDNTSEDTAVGYVETIHRALENGWSKEHIGHHIVRNNTIAHCEQAGIVGSMGAIFSTITGNVIHDIHVRQLFSGFEMAGIKLHAPIDTLISGNHIFRTTRGIWLDWMTQGTRVSANLLHDNHSPEDDISSHEDLFVEVNHGPFLVDNNFFLSPRALMDWSEGGAYVHNLFAGEIIVRPELERETPYHKPHSTKLAGLRNIVGGDSRFYNNIFAGYNGLEPYNKAALPMQMAGNVFLGRARPAKDEEAPLVLPEFDPQLSLVKQEDCVNLGIVLKGISIMGHRRQIITSELLGVAKVPELPFEQPDGTSYRIGTDYFGHDRGADNPFPGPFKNGEAGTGIVKVWPVRQ